MNKLLNWGINVAAVISSMYFQHVDSQVIWVALIFFIVFFLGELLRLIIMKRKISLKELFDSPLLRALSLFLCGTVAVSAYYSIESLKAQKESEKDESARQELFETNIGQQIVRDIVLDCLQRDNHEPTIEWCESAGISNESHLAEYICGSYYLKTNPTDYQKARSFFETASSSCPLALFDYGKMVYYGYGDIPDKESGLLLIQKAAEQEVLEAHYFLFGKAVIEDNSRKAISEYAKYEKALCDTVNIRFENTALFDYFNDEKRARAYRIADEAMLSWHESRWSLFCTMLPFCMSDNNPNAALNAIDEYFKPIKRIGTIPYMINYLKYFVLMRSGNTSQANKYERKGISGVPSTYGMQYEFSKECVFNFLVKKEEDLL